MHNDQIFKGDECHTKLMIGIEIQNDGTCCSKKEFKMNKRSKKITLDGATIHIHFMDVERKLALVSTVSFEEMIQKKTSLHTLCLPPPLNKYVYPNPLYAIRYDQTILENMSESEFLELCGMMRKESHRLAEMQMAVYDVQPIMESQDEEEDLSDDELCDEESDEASQEEEDSDHDWEFEDDDPPPV